MQINTRYFMFCHANGSFFFRLFGYGLSVVNRNIWPPLFSERTGHLKRVYVGRYAIRHLTPES